jgi:DNA-binding response OmpR family regulator
MRLLVVEEDDLIATSVDFRLRKHGFVIERVVGGETAIAAVNRALPDIMIIASKLTDMNGLELVAFLHKQYPDLIMVYMAEIEAWEEIMRSIQLGARDFVLKPYKPDELLIRLKILLKVQ